MWWMVNTHTHTHTSRIATWNKMKLTISRKIKFRNTWESVRSWTTVWFIFPVSGRCLFFSFYVVGFKSPFFVLSFPRQSRLTRLTFCLRNLYIKCKRKRKQKSLKNEAKKNNNSNTYHPFELVNGFWRRRISFSHSYMPHAYIIPANTCFLLNDFRLFIFFAFAFLANKWR